MKKSNKRTKNLIFKIGEPKVSFSKTREDKSAFKAIFFLRKYEINWFFLLKRIYITLFLGIYFLVSNLIVLSLNELTQVTNMWLAELNATFSKKNVF